MNLQLRRAAMALLLSVMCFTAFAQKTVKGTVKDVSGEPLIGVSIVYGNGQGTVTDFDGNFTVSVPDNTTLKISYVGYKPQSVNVAGKSTRASATFVNVVTAHEDTTLWKQVMQNALGELKTFKRKYARYKEFANVISAIEELERSVTA